MPLTLLAFDAEDLAVMSAHLQDAVVAADDIAWAPREKRFALLCQRPDHVGDEPPRSCGLHFDFVRKVERLRFPASSADSPQKLTLIGLAFEPTDSPSGMVTLLFNGGAAIRLTVECIEATMRDLIPHQKG